MRIRDALVGVLALGAATVAWNASPLVAMIAAPVSAGQRGYAAGKYGLELNGALAGWLHSVEGGHATSDVVVERPGADHIQRKHLAGVRYEELKLEAGTAMSKSFYAALKDVTDGKVGRLTGAVVTADADFTETSRLTFHNALITEVGFPALDAASRDPARLTIRLLPELSRFTQAQSGAKGNVVGSTAALDANAQKRWMASNFRLRIAGLDEACQRVSRIEPITIKRKATRAAVGERDAVVEPELLEFSNLVISFPESHAKAFYDWHESFVVGGKNGQESEKSGSLEFLSPNLQEVLFTLTFKNLGIVRFAPEKVEAANEAIRRVKAEMYVEKIDFSYHSSWQ